MQDPFDDQPMNWATSDRQSPSFDLSDVGQAEPDSFCWQQPPPNENYITPIPSPLEFNTDIIPLDFNTQSTVPEASYEQGDGNQPLLEISRSPSTRQQQQQQKLKCPHSQSHYSDSICPANLSDQSALSYNHSIASANSTDSSISNANEGISICTQIISQLESQICDSRLGLDGVLRISKSCISGLFQITNLESCKTNPNCLLLLCVAVNQITTLFENNIPAMNSLLTTLSVSKLPSLLFGSFQVDQEDQLAFCTRLICREIQRCRQLLDRMSSMYHHHQQQQQSYQPNNSVHSIASLLQKQWFLASAGRLDSLVAAVTA